MEHNITGLQNPADAMEFLKEHYGIEGGRIEDGRLIIVDESNAGGASIQEALRQLGAKDQTTRGNALFIRQGSYQNKIRKVTERTGRPR